MSRARVSAVCTRFIAAAAMAIVLVAPGCRLLHRNRDAPPPPPIIDLNRAPLRKVEQLPGITPSMARRIVDGRPYEEADDLVARGVLTPRELDRIRDRIAVERPAR